ncbi:MAG: ABC transporter permease, partial [Bacteroidota bacterium]
MFKHKAFLLINVLGLALGIATCLAIIHYVRFELGYDKSHTHAQRIYRVSTAIYSDGSEENIAPAIYGLAPALQTNYEEVEAAVRLVPTTAIIKQKDGTLTSEDYFFLADPEIFQVFTHPMLAGDPTKALQRPNSVVLSQSMAKKYLGNAPPASLIGNQLVLDGQTYELTGIIEDVPKNSDLRFDALLSWEYNPDEWLELGSFTYLLLKPDVQPEAFAQKLATFDQQVVAPRVAQDWGTSTITVRHHLYPLTELHYTTGLLGDTEEKGNKNYVYIFSLIALIILIVAGVNYVNLFIAQATRRNVEVGVAKAMGASQWQLGWQYISECFIITLLALVLALAIVLLAGQTFANLLGTPIVWQTLLQSDTLGILLSLVLLISIVAGSYPTLVLASSRAVVALKGSSFLHRSRGRLRKVFIAFQFTVAISLVAGALIVREQVFYMQYKDLGFQQKEIAAVSIPFDADGSQKAQAFKQHLQQDSRVDGVSIGSRPDGLWSWSSVSITAQGQTKTM